MQISSLVLAAMISVSAHAATEPKDHHREMIMKSGVGGLRAVRLLQEHRPTQSRIVGGSDADDGKYPFFVEWDGCGASLIHSGTAYGCFQ